MMKTKTLFFAILMLGITLSACKKDSEDEFNNANEDVAEKLIKSVEIYNNNNPGDMDTYIINYDANNRVTSYVSNNSSSFLNYNTDGSLSSTYDGYEIISMSDFYQVPYNAFEDGEVVEYDNVGNPIKINVWQNGYGSNLLIGDIIYDPNPNPFFYTLKAAGIIDVLDRIDLNFGYNDPIIIQARKLLFLNNPRANILKDMFGITQHEMQISYIYDSDSYPTHAEMIAITSDGTYNYSANYYYK